MYLRLFSRKTEKHALYFCSSGFFRSASLAPSFLRPKNVVSASNLASTRVHYYLDPGQMSFGFRRVRIEVNSFWPYASLASSEVARRVKNNQTFFSFIPAVRLLKWRFFFYGFRAMRLVKKSVNNDTLHFLTVCFCDPIGLGEEWLSCLLFVV